MDLFQFRTFHNNDPVFTIADKINNLKIQFLKDFKNTFSSEQKLKNASIKLGKFFYYIFVFNVSAKVSNLNVNNNYGFLNCSSLNFKKIDRHYRIYLNYLYKHLFIIYPLIVSRTGKKGFRLHRQYY